MCIDHLRYFSSNVNIEYILYIGAFVSLVTLIVFPNNNKIKFSFFIYISIWLSILFLTSLYFIGNYNIKRLIYLNQGIWIAVSMQKNTLNVRVVRIFLLLMIVFYLYRIMSGIDASNFFPNVSRNGISVYLLVMMTLYCIACHENGKVINLFFPFIITIITAWAEGRSGFIAAILISSLIVREYLKGDQSTGKRKILLRVLIVSLGFLLIAIAHSQFSVSRQNYFDLVISRFQTEGLASGRGRIWNEYFSDIISKFKHFVFGSPMAKLPILRSMNSNPHNSLILLHTQIGFGALVGIVIIVVSEIKLVRTNFLYFGLLFVLVLRSMTDIIAFPGIFDFLIYYFVFSAIDRSKHNTNQATY